MDQGFTHRTVSGWISDFSSTPRLEPWPSITLDGLMEADLVRAFDTAAASGYTAVILWGLLAGRSWAPHLPDTVDEDRRQRVLRLMEQARRRGLKLLMGLGLYSWGFDDIIAAYPELDGGSPSTMCGSRPQSWEWMRRVVDFVFDGYDPDGVSMQSSDMGRCPCDECRALPSLAYHAAINRRVSEYIRSRRPGKLIEISTWGMDLSNPEEAGHVREMCAAADILNDFNNSSAARGREQRARLIASLPCAFGTEQGWWVDPQPFWRRDRWFIPFALANVPYLRALHRDGGRAVQRYILPLANPGAEVGLIFDGLMLQDVGRDPEAALRRALQVFEPTAAATDALVEVWRSVEAAFIAAQPEPERPRTVGLNGSHYRGLAPDAALADRPEYLLRLRPDALAAYGAALAAAGETVRRLTPDLGDRDRADRLRRSVALAHADVARVQAYRAPS